jgi:hypothetical protein
VAPGDNPQGESNKRSAAHGYKHTPTTNIQYSPNLWPAISNYFLINLDNTAKMKFSSALPSLFIAGTLGGVLALTPPPIATKVVREGPPACSWNPSTSDPGTCSADIPTMYTTAASVVPRAPVSKNLATPTTNTKACMICTRNTIDEGNCKPIPDCIPQIAVATVTVGSAPVHVGTLTGTALYTSVSVALESLCPPVTQTTSSTQCSETGQAEIGGVQYVDSDESLETGSLIIKVPTSGYNITSMRDAMIASIALSIQTSATGKNCFNISYTVEKLNRRNSIMGYVDDARSFFGLMEERDRPSPGRESMGMCNSAYSHTASYYNPFWTLAPKPGPSDFMNALFTFQASNSDQFICEFLDMLTEGLSVLAPEFAVEDVELEEGIDALCCLEDGSCSTE